ncbi:MAG TPA: AsnC family transcriptional regulator, partial [Candidatus Choladousia intestinigallinarum]|nr:AsnC family transcriptional regulator [Candidatus Choladousia intestinigallinarum]
MDALDYKILAALKKNARIKASDLAREIHLSVSAVIDRIHKLETSGVICSYTAITDDIQLGNDLTALMEISLEHPRYSDSFVHYIQK